MKGKAVIWGGGGTGQRILSSVQEKYDVLFFIDSDSKKWGYKINDYEIYPPTKLTDTDYDWIIVASLPGYDTIMNKVLEMSIDSRCVISSFVEQPLMCRIQFLNDYAKQCYRFGIKGNCAEAGVFEGNFAKHINQAFYDRKLYLFDTFEGFSEKDISEEIQFSCAKTGDYNNTSEELVLDKMRYKENVNLVRGYFPDSAKEIRDEFCFVNLDLDLYKPTLNGLNWSKNKIVRGGVVLIHDYFSENFRGPRKAVDDFLAKNSNLRAYPIGDGISILIVGY